MLAYGHYDVQPALLEDGWNTPPFEAYSRQDEVTFSRKRTTDDKGPVIGWLKQVTEAYNELKWELPVNLVVCFEGMEESGSLIKELTGREAKQYFNKVDTVAYFRHLLALVLVNLC